MAANFTLFISTTLLLALVVIGLKRRMLGIYPMFYSYLGAVILSDVLRSASRNYYHPHYLQVYWYTQFLCVAFGFGILWEIYGAIFKDFPGAARVARFLVSLALGIVLLNGLIQATVAPEGVISSVVSLERNMRLVQAVLLALGISLVIYYEIPIGLNASGILFGYGGFVIAGIVLLSLREHFGTEFYKWWASGQSFSYRAALAVWLVTMYRYRPAVVATSRAMVEDYDRLARTTRTSLAKMRTTLGKALQP